MLYRVTYLKKLSMLISADTPEEARQMACPWYQYPPRENPDMTLLSVEPAVTKPDPKTWPGPGNPGGGGPNSAWPNYVVTEEDMKEAA